MDKSSTKLVLFKLFPLELNLMETNKYSFDRVIEKSLKSRLAKKDKVEPVLLK